MNELHEKAIRMATKFCEGKGFEILATGWEGPAGKSADIVADDGGTICFIGVTVHDLSENGFGRFRVDRAAWEAVAAHWFASDAFTHDATVRFDRCDIMIVGKGRALLRYCTNALSRD